MRLKAAFLLENIFVHENNAIPTRHNSFLRFIYYMEYTFSLLHIITAIFYRSRSNFNCSRPLLQLETCELIHLYRFIVFHVQRVKHNTRLRKKKRKENEISWNCIPRHWDNNIHQIPDFSSPSNLPSNLGKSADTQEAIRYHRTIKSLRFPFELRPGSLDRSARLSRSRECVSKRLSRPSRPINRRLISSCHFLFLSLSLSLSRDL